MILIGINPKEYTLNGVFLFNQNILSAWLDRLPHMLVWLKFSTMAVGALCVVVCESGISQLQTHLSCVDSLDSVQLSGQSWWLSDRIGDEKTGYHNS